MNFIFLYLIYYQPPELCSELDCDNSRFSYVVELKTFQKVCFNSIMPRRTGCIGKGLSPHQKRVTPENNPKTGPGSYSPELVTSSMYKVLNKVRSIYGVPPLGTKTQRFKYRKRDSVKVPSRYQWTIPEERVFRSMAKPFGIGSAIRQLMLPNIPGPADYNLQRIYVCRRPKYQYNFGKPSMVSAVETICVPDPTHHCHLCGRFCEGEYWHKDYGLFICQICFDIEKATKEYYDPHFLKQFKKLRNCSFMHQHNKTKAKLRILPQNKIIKKFAIENYLDNYIDTCLNFSKI
ncbi:uncharacterized protein LOC130898305 [Diorhabda carinulata]|uniref:uncharacterized protein LOC130898305 n=1 Tax=Diorhabda carinulata TaxID=1163345 RepID=UPI0025A21BC8|nr:uncharacterized protein LOC130898305 [Diorhabda carinulata]